jgi:HK97 family phage major capsid protein
VLVWYERTNYLLIKILKMSKIKELQENYEVAIERQTELMKIRSGEAIGISKRELNEDELAEFDLLEEQITKLKRQIETENKFVEASKRNASVKFMDVRNSKETPEEKAQKEYSLLRAINLKASNRPLDGIEAEMQQQAESEARANGRAIEGLSLPQFMVHVPNHRDLTVGTAATAGNLVSTDLGGYTPALMPRLKAVEMGAQVMTGLTGNLDLPIGDGLASAAWEGENDTTAETTPTTKKISLSPNRLAAFIDLSKQLTIQGTPSAEAWARTELEGAMSRAVDYAIINGSGASNQPEGILNKTGIGDVAMGTNGLAPTNAAIIELETLIATANADVEQMGYLTTPGIRGYLKNLALSANNAGFVWDGNGSRLNGYNAQVSTQVPSDLVKGSSSDCHAVIFGNWNHCIVGQWGTVDIIVNPYTKGKEGLIELIVNSYWDVGIKHAGSFAAIQDALTS